MQESKQDPLLGWVSQGLCRMKAGEALLYRMNEATPPCVNEAFCDHHRSCQ